MFKYYLMTFGTRNILFVRQKFDSGWSWFDLEYFGAVWVLATAFRQAARELDVPECTPEGLVRASKMLCAHWMHHASAGWSHVRPDGPSSVTIATKINFFGFCVLVFHSNLFQTTSKHFLTLQKLLWWYVWLQTPFGQKLSFKFDLIPLKSYILVQNST